MTKFDENLAPEPITGVDFRTLEVSPTPEEFFLLSRVDGCVSIAHLCSTSGLGKEKTLKCIETLRTHGLIRFPGDPPPSAAPVNNTAAQPAAASSAEPAEKTKSAEEEAEALLESLHHRFPINFEDFVFDEELLAQEIEIEESFKREVLFIYSQLDDVNFYELLGVSTDASRKELRRGYFRMSKRYHPDRFFRKLLGDFQPMIEKIFQRITRAYKTLSHRRKRDAYDISLRGGRTPRATPIQASTPASQRSEPIEDIQSSRKQEMAFKVLTGRGDEAMDEGRTLEAVRQYRKALSLKHDFTMALTVARRLMEVEEHLDDAISFARAAQKIDPASIDTLKVVGQIYERKGSLDDALYHFEEALKSAPDDSELQACISRIRSDASEDAPDHQLTDDTPVKHLE